MSTTWQLQWAFGEANVQALGGMLAPVTFQFPDGRSISPLHTAFWGEQNDPALSGIMRRLRGEWACLPYGPACHPSQIPSDWLKKPLSDEWDHGYCANHEWQLLSQTDHELSIAIVYPENQVIEKLVRTFSVNPMAAEISVNTMVYAKESVTLPFALHPTFRTEGEEVEIIDKGFELVHTYPYSPEPGVSQLVPNSHCGSLKAVPSEQGNLDLTHLPLEQVTEELLQLADCTGRLSIRYHKAKVDVHLDWDTPHLPDALIWISNGGRSHYPWGGKHYALGIEPCNSFFDLTRVVEPPKSHPLSRRNGIHFTSGTPVSIAYKISAE
ncbi:hypothetical protein LIN78_15735 [Leeia sp. TBRC 13508]|uniref:Aldose 1-epimerase n=1 Tax=Leeia speluncae TaxID=2884804 RepID=A0ABS8DBJ3_9NEIS|nr:hypothetical protein [Leeia speluncae]MCB6184998.1 hypothetical protein [Leeia speluncae]